MICLKVHCIDSPGTRLLFTFALLCGMSLCAGCGGNSGPERYDYSGTVNYQGKPVPAGYITFTPDKSRGNAGPGAHADIENGEYTTMAGQGPIGGPHIVVINGFEGKPAPGTMNPSGRYVFENRRLEVDLPKKSGTYDIEVPLR